MPSLRRKLKGLRYINTLEELQINKNKPLSDFITELLLQVLLDMGGFLNLLSSSFGITADFFFPKLFYLVHMLVFLICLLPFICPLSPSFSSFEVLKICVFLVVVTKGI